MLIPRPEPLDEYFPALTCMVAQTSWLPHPDTVKALAGAAFPTSRARKLHPRLSRIQENGEVVGMYDDNATPEWAVFWAHGLKGTRPKGWTIAHVWSDSDAIRSYTHLANLVMVREPFASLTDKNGPLTVFLRWHAWKVYAWKPERENEPRKPSGYDSIEWRYLERVDDPKVLIQQRLEEVNNQRAKILRPIMESRQMV